MCYFGLRQAAAGILVPIDVVSLGNGEVLADDGDNRPLTTNNKCENKQCLRHQEMARNLPEPKIAH
jgi:hypothetical protein